MAKLSYLLDLSVIAELSRPNGNRRVFTLFQQRQGTCAIGAPASYALLRGITGLHDSARRAQLQAFCSGLLFSGPTVLPFDQTSEERRVGKAGVSSCRFRGSPFY